MRRYIILAAALLAAPCAASAQQSIQIPPRDAMQCAVWASIASAAMSDDESRFALLYTFSYFVGQFEGGTGKSIRGEHDEAAIVEVARDPDKFTPICKNHMAGFSPRMAEWGGILTELGERLDAEGNK